MDDLSKRRSRIAIDADASASFTLPGLLRVCGLAFAALTLWAYADSRGNAARDDARVFAFLPVVGLIVGAALALIDFALGRVMGDLARSIVILLLLTLVTGAMFPLRLAVTIDALRAGARPAATGLAQMTPLGAMCALAALALEIWRLASLAGPSHRVAMLVLATMLSRAVITPVGWALRPLERWGLGLSWGGGISTATMTVCCALALLIAGGLFGADGLAAFGIAALSAIGVILVYRFRFGGAAGYTLAGAGAITELVLYLVSPLAR